MRDRITEAIWQTAQLPHVMEALAARAGLDPNHGRTPRAPGDTKALAAWFESAGAALGVEVTALDVRGFRVEEALRGAGPALIPLQEGTLALLDAGRRNASLLKPDLRVVRVPVNDLRRYLCRQVEAPYREEVERLLEECGIAAGRRGRAAETLLRERTRYQRAVLLYTLRRPPGRGFLATVRAAGLSADLTMLLTSHLAEYVLLMASWWVLGRAVLQGQVDTGVLAAWALLLVSMVPFRIAAAWLQGRIAVGFGGLLRERLLDGALKLRPDEVRHQGAGAFLGQAIEAEQMETMAISGGVLAALALLEMLLSFVVLMFGAGSLLQAAVLAAWIAISVWLARRYYTVRREWTTLRLGMTGDLIEAMTGHRTRLAQQPPAEWHDNEDQVAARYLAVSQQMDRIHARIMGVVPRGYLVSSLAALAPAFLAATPSTGNLAVALGAIIIAWQAFRRMSGGLAQLCGAGISWQAVAGLFRASSREADAGAVAQAAGESEVALSAREIAFQYSAGGRTVFSGVSLDVRQGDWLLLEGASGGGKSTLVSVLTGLRRPTGGLLLAGGLDIGTLGGAQWRRRIAAAPQYHENHVLGNTFGFNLLMGRTWPAPEADLAEAAEVCRELGLGPLLERMPGGLFQMVGETGWQLSQGERSRLFLARALLQRPEVVVLDESFAALDPENLRQALECTLRRAKTVIVVAHP